MNCTIEVEIKTHNYDNKTGLKKYATEIVAESPVMLDKPNNGGADKAEINASFD